MCPSFRSVDPMRWVTINFTRQRDLLFAADIDNLLGAIIFCNFFGFNPLNTILATFFNYKYYYLVSYSCLYVVIMQVTTPKAQTICCCHCHRTSELWNFQSAFQILGGFHILFLKHKVEFKLQKLERYFCRCMFSLGHGLRTPNEGINQRNLKIWADAADKICFGHT